MIVGARQGVSSGLRRLLAWSMARDLGVYIIPGPEIARANGLDIDATGMHIVASPRHASILLVVGELPLALRDAATVIYAQMMRPRVLLTLGASDLSPLPLADVTANVSQQALLEAVSQIRSALAAGSFRADVSDFDAPALQTRIEYTCSMHPEIVRDEPGSCPKCGMNLIPREAQAIAGHDHADTGDSMKHDAEEHTEHDHHMAHSTEVEYTCPMHPEVVQNEPGSCPKCGMNLEPRDVEEHTEHDHHMGHDTEIEYTCPMHPEVVQNEPGSCPKCGMNLEPREQHEHSNMDHSSMDHSNMDHGDMGFMSMIDVTKDLPRSSDGLPMDWIDVPFGPFFPGLPGGLLVTLTLDGDTVAGSRADTLVGSQTLLQGTADADQFIHRLAHLDPLAPVCYSVLACLAIENAAVMDADIKTATTRIAAVEQERIISHLGWLALFGQQTGFDWLLKRATSIQQDFLSADIKQLAGLQRAVSDLSTRLRRTPLLKSRTVGIGRLTIDNDAKLFGPIARASGIHQDERDHNSLYRDLGFLPASGKDGDVRARLQLRLDEICHSLALIERAGGFTDLSGISLNRDVAQNIEKVSGSGEAVIETPRGSAQLQLVMERGKVVSAQLQTPSTSHLALIETLTAQQELGDALVTIGSLDLSPWEIRT